MTVFLFRYFSLQNFETSAISLFPAGNTANPFTTTTSEYNDFIKEACSDWQVRYYRLQLNSFLVLLC